MIKLIATDIDGTLVKDGSSTMPEELKDTIEALLDRGVLFAAATGRSLISAQRLFGPLQDRIYFMACNGTQTGHGRELLFSEDLDPELLGELIADIRTYPDVVPFLTGNGFMYSDTDDRKLVDWLREGYQEDITGVSDIMDNREHVVKLSVYDRKLRSGETFRPFCEKWRDRVSVVTAGAMWLDVYKAGINKGTAVRKLQASLGVSPEETMAFGDQQNDVELLKAAHYSYAVGNALPEVKATARYAAGACEEGGAMKVMQRLLKEGGAFRG